MTMIPLKRKAAFLGQQTYRLNAPKPRVAPKSRVAPKPRILSPEQRSKYRPQDREQHSKRRIEKRVILESIRARSAEEIVELARERYRLSMSN